MPRKRQAWVIAAFVLTALLAGVQITRVFILRFESGDQYPPYSSYRSDPMGMRVLYEALGTLEGIEARRYEDDMIAVGDGDGRTLLVAGAYDSPDPKKTIEALESFVSSGGRLVIAYTPETFGKAWLSAGRRAIEKQRREGMEQEDQQEGEGEGEGEGEAEGEAERKEEEFALLNISERWGYTLGRAFLGDSGWTRAARDDAAATLPANLVWRSPGFFKNTEAHWRVLYRVKERPVLIARNWDSGAIVLSTDSYFLSNEAMREHRNPALLAWLIGPNTSVLVDESHHGIYSKPGIMNLLRDYNYHGVLMALALVAGLFIWKNATSLGTRPGEEEQAQAAQAQSGTESFAGLRHLMRRTVPQKKLVHKCRDIWLKDFERHPHKPAVEKRGRTLKLAANPETSAVAQYNALLEAAQGRDTRSPQEQPTASPSFRTSPERAQRGTEG